MTTYFFGFSGFGYTITGALVAAGYVRPPTVTDCAVQRIGSLSAIRASTLLDCGSPHNTRLFLAMSASFTAVSSFDGASPRIWVRHSFAACSRSKSVHLPTKSFIGVPVGSTFRNASMNASLIGPCRSWCLRKANPRPTPLQRRLARLRGR